MLDCPPLAWGRTLIAFACLQVGLIDPGAFKQIDELIQKELKGKGGRVETLSFAAVEGEATIE